MPSRGGGRLTMRDSASLRVDNDLVLGDKTVLNDIPPAVVAAVLALAVIALAGLTAYVALHLDDLTATIRGPGPMTGQFNIAVAEFGQLNEHGGPPQC